MCWGDTVGTLFPDALAPLHTHMHSLSFLEKLQKISEEKKRKAREQAAAAEAAGDESPSKLVVQLVAVVILYKSAIFLSSLYSLPLLPSCSSSFLPLPPLSFLLSPPPSLFSLHLPPLPLHQSLP